MKFSTKAGIIGFLLALSTFNASETSAKIPQSDRANNPSTIESRLSALSEAIRKREAQLPDSPDTDISPNSDSNQYAWGNWTNAGGRRWGNTRRWSNANRPGGSFTNFKQPFRNWPNVWRDGTGFVNFRNY